MLIVLEGLDGAGKSHQFQLLTQHLTEKNYSTYFLHFPRLDIAPFGRLIADYLAGKFGSLSQVNPYLIATVYANDQYLALQDLINKRQDTIILLDRYYYSNMAYQTSRLPTQEKEAFRHWLQSLIYSFHMPEPDLAIYLHTPSAFRQNNLQKRDFIDLHEQNQQYQQDVHDEYLKMCQEQWHGLQALDCSVENNCMAEAPIIHEKILSLIHQVCMNDLTHVR